MLGVAASLVFVIAAMLGNGSDGDPGKVSSAARQAGAAVESTAVATSVVTAGPAGSAAARAGAVRAKGTTAPVPTPTPTVAAPQGPCDPADILVTPAVARGAVAGGDVAIGLSLRTLQAEACTWQVGPKSVVVKIADGPREIWTTRHCRKAVPVQPVVVRRATSVAVSLTWNARKSDEGCRAGKWVLGGTYSVAAATLGGEPTETEFVLGAPARPTITITPKAKPTKKPKKPTN